ncbi:response regulator [Arcobacteraceae bacterium]|nr:response regulator [Arcobacteraceae bacterium]
MKSDLTLLYVEDDKLVRENYTEVFESYFTTVLTTDNGKEALKIYNENKIDVGIFDISIPGINGLNLTSQIREEDENIEIIIISAYSDRDKLLKAVSLKLFTYLIKPVPHNDLITTIENLVHKKTNHENIKLANGYIWNATTKTLFYKDETIKITQKEIDIVELLFKNKNIYLSACQIQEYISNELVSGSDSCNGIIKILSRFKKKLNIQFDNDDFFIENCYGLGYKILL